MGSQAFAREIAAIFDLPLINEDMFLVNLSTKHFKNQAPITSDNLVSITVNNQEICRRFAAISIPKFKSESSNLFIASRLCRVDAKPIDAIVDATNYVMFDWSQPMHAFDAATFSNHQLITRFSNQGEKLKLLDGQEVTLTAQDYVITDGKKPISLAGIMGGADSAVSEKTTSLIVESANFDPTTIRLTSARFKKRTEGSARWKKI